MNRRGFLGIFVAAAGVALLAPSAPAQASTLFDELKDGGVEPCNDAADVAEADLPAEKAEDAQYYYRRRYYRRPRAYYRPRVYYRPRYVVRRRRRYVCRNFINSWGRVRRRCWWTY